MAPKKWTAIVLTCRDKDSAQAYQHELFVRQEKQFIHQDVIILTVEDPKTQVGSGGATLNALLAVAEHISAKQGYSVVNPDVLKDAHILIIHMGRHFPFDSCGRSFTCLPLVWSEGKVAASSLICNIDVLLYNLTHKIAHDSPPGVWICSSDMILDIPEPCTDLDLKTTEAFVISVPGSTTYAKDHGVYKFSPDGRVLDIIYKGTPEELKSCCIEDTGMVPLVSGVVFLGRLVAERILGFHTVPPLDSCTYLGLDSGSSPIQLSLFFDFMLAMCPDVSKEEFISGKKSGPCGKVLSSIGHNGSIPKLTEETSAMALQLEARSFIWKELRDVIVRGCLVKSGSHNYMNLSPVIHHTHLSNLPVHDSAAYRKTTHVHSIIQPTANLSSDCVIMNSIIGEGTTVGKGAAISHCHLPAGLSVGENCLLGGLHLADEPVLPSWKILDDLSIQEYRIHLSVLDSHKVHCIRVVFGRLDDLKATSDRNLTFCNQKITEFCSRTGISAGDLWDSSTPAEEKNLLNARLFPVLHAREEVAWSDTLWLSGSSTKPAEGHLERWKTSWRLSLDDILSFVDVAAEFKWRRHLYFSVGEILVRDTLLNCGDDGWNVVFASAAVEGYSQQMLQMLDKVALESDSHGIAARTLANIADVLGNMGASKGGLRSGPAGNEQWKKAFDLLEKKQIGEGVRALAKERKNWLDRPDLLIRAARHYEGAGQILIRHAVMSARKFMKTIPCEPPPMGKWVTTACPVRIDISGGWSDTPPITYEHGGVVLNAAILVDDIKPVGARVKRIPDPQVVLQLGKTNQATNRLILTELSQFSDFSHPHATGALLKTAFICVGIIEYPSQTSLRDQLLQNYGGGFELHTWAELPHGSGMGTSSILAGAVIAALLRASGKKFDIASLIHAVLHVEQMLTTGGGWQDQVGGLMGGVKVGHSKGELPLNVQLTFPKMSQKTLQAFSDRLVLVYTGKTRLARNLLQTVVRNWYARNPDIMETVDQLVVNAWKCAEAFEKGDLAGVGHCINTYWTQKKTMARGTEPIAIKHMMNALKPYTLGISLTGAGGGGFLYMVTKEPNAIDTIKEVIHKFQEALPETEDLDQDHLTVHKCCVDQEGLTVHVEDIGHEELKAAF